MRFKGKFAVVTGAAQGIGRAIARRLAQEGATVVIGDLNEKGAAATAKELEQEGLKVTGRLLDVSNRESVASFFKQLEREHGKVDILVNNAGAASENRFLNLSEDEWRHAMGVIMDGTFFCSQAAARLMKKTSTPGAIINIASQGARTSKPGRVHYSAAKGGVVQLTRASAIDLGPYNIRVNSICPGGIATGMSEYLLQNPEKMAGYCSHVPMGRLGKTEEVASVVAFLASDDASFLTAANIDVDGGKNALGSSLRATD